MKRRLSLATALAVLLPILMIGLAARASLTYSAQSGDPVTGGKARVAPALEQTLASLAQDEMISVIVTLSDQADLGDVGIRDRPARLKEVTAKLKEKASASQRGLKALLLTRFAQGEVSRTADFWVFNGLAVTATRGVIEELAARPEVASITPDEVDIVPASPAAAGEPEPNVTLVNAPVLWALGWQGQGIVVANMDTGVDLNHPDLTAKWRGGTNSWYDPYSQHPASPADLNGHGTWTMGVMVGGDAGGSAIGVAPDASWIAVKIFNDQGSATATAIHQGFQWLLDPDGNSETADAPHVVNNSWSYDGPGCSLEFQLDLQALQAAGILPVFAAGNYGPYTSSSVSPANNPEAFAVGAINNSSQFYTYSSRGPSACGEATSIYPEIVAPGVSVKTTDRYGMYYYATGTSIAAPHVAGALALLLDAFPSLTAEQQRAALTSAAVDLGVAGPDNSFGYGRLDVYAAYQWLTSTPPGPTATPTPDPTPVPTATPTPGPSPTAPPTSTPAPDAIFADGFESGGFGAWTSAATNGGRLTVSSRSAMVGGKGMEATIGGTAIYVADASPTAENSYHARFYFSPNSVLIKNGKTQDIFVGRSASGVQLFRVQLRYSNGSYQLRGLVRSGGKTELATAWYSISNAPHAVEIAWQAASSATTADGSLGLWIDGAKKETRGGVASASHRLEEVRLGPQAISAGTSGTEFFDAFASRRAAYIGP